MTTAKEIAALPLSAQTLIGLTALQETFHNRISEMARAIHAIRADAFPYRKVKGAFDHWNDFERNDAYLDGFEINDSDPANLMIKARFAWWCGDSLDGEAVSFPIGYLDMTEAQWRGVELAAVGALKAEHDAKAARAAEKAAITRAETKARQAEQARAKAVETIPGFDALPAETQDAIVANMAKEG